MPDFWLVELPIDPTRADDVAALLIAGGALGAELQGGSVRASYPPLEPNEIREMVRDALAELDCPLPELQVTGGTDTDWVARFKESLQPLQIGRVWIIPSWSSFVEPPSDIGIRLDPGMAFGTGQHATTALCLQLLQEMQPESLLDVGCGSGILAIAAIKLGCRTVTAIDNDPVAIEVAQANASANGVTLQTEQDLTKIDRRYDLVIANILAPTLIQLATRLEQRVRPGGKLILSGLLASQRGDVEAAFKTVSCEHRQQDEWLALVMA